jgi:hypothetical protein
LDGIRSLPLQWDLGYLLLGCSVISLLLMPLAGLHFFWRTPSL